ncbi:MAG: hypothetical protein A3C58_01395 [Candidatus Staskawiczbacteria bacterium RIFCSPHIGHO2_02_FULL_34_10]|uniref:UDP-N-acetylglucosamine--N-acetylmuramyl-(pentapeptide) pyrophosphoryl-undecaprenol N-acetylglucosamine transferase n=2 Tax=Candidatus Staskawicziibacteriota TaxID=1817916 RepID=A0A1G2HKG8_9BACT|nr:MAG: hypothetical protein A2639_01660 [Candidatus Staskawiczbacteria bacterium RIFCSPHIGHO2_01_FULL_34_27]OGZ67835.1 MAG: hypothetical protein A3C58_01395 [Candidatus Staskawiczbacteria bacterium RIFCSPHIGHO2_02_FULL_34_10]
MYQKTAKHMKKIKILFTGGGTGGHLMPIISIGREIRRLYNKDDMVFYYLGPKNELSFLLLSQENIKPYAIISGKLRRYFSFENITDILFKIPIGFIQSFFLLLFIRPKLVFSKGGSGSAVVALCARILFIKVFLHESDSVPGLSNRIVSKWAKKIFISFPKTEYFDLDKTILVGNPIKKELSEGNNETAKEIFNLTLKKPTILFLGGSQGAQKINDFILEILNELLKKYEIVHVCGIKNYKNVRAESQVIMDKDLIKYYHLYEYLNEVELKHIYKVANLIISRSGSGSIFEIASLGKPSILIPLPSSASNHQSKNAYQYANTGAAIVIEQENLTPNFFLGKIDYLFLQPEKIEEMKVAALNFAKPLAGKAIAREILESIL